MKTTCKLLALFFALLLLNIAQAQSDSSDSISALANYSGESEFSTHSTDNPLPESPASEAANRKITARPEFISTRKCKSVDDFINSKIEFPEEARSMGLYGKVKVQFDILPSGTLANIAILESPDSVFSEEVRKILADMPKWQPAYCGETAVTSKYQLNIDFSLQ